MLGTRRSAKSVIPRLALATAVMVLWLASPISSTSAHADSCLTLTSCAPTQQALSLMPELASNSSSCALGVPAACAVVNDEIAQLEDIINGTHVGCDGALQSACAMVLADAQVVVNLALGVVNNCASGTDPTCNNLINLAQEMADLAVRTAEQCAAGTNPTCTAAINLVLVVVDIGRNFAETCADGTNATCNLVLDTAQREAASAVDTVTACANETVSACALVLGTVRDGASEVLRTVTQCTAGEPSSLCGAALAQVQMVLDAVATAVGDCADTDLQNCDQFQQLRRMIPQEPLPPGETVDPFVVSMQYNMCGWHCNRGFFSGELIVNTAALINANATSIVSLNEVCLAQAQAVQETLNDTLGRNFGLLFLSTQNVASTCPVFGNALLWDRDQLGPLQTGSYHCWFLAPLDTTPPSSTECGPNPSAGRSGGQGVACIELHRALSTPLLTISEPVVACTTHVIAGSDPSDASLRTTQVQEVQADIGGWTVCPGNHCASAVLILGDLNAQPEEAALNPLYAHWGESGATPLNWYQGRSNSELFTYPTSVILDGNLQTLEKIDYQFFGTGFIPYREQLQAPGWCQDSSNQPAGICSDHFAYYMGYGFAAVT